MRSTAIAIVYFAISHVIACMGAKKALNSPNQYNVLTKLVLQCNVTAWARRMRAELKQQATIKSCQPMAYTCCQSWGMFDY